MTFCGTFRKNDVECTAHHEILYDACVWFKKIHLAKNVPQNAKDSLGSLPETFVQRFSVKEEFLRISENSPKIPRTGASFK